MPQAIILTNDDVLYWRIYVFLCLNELIYTSTDAVLYVAMYSFAATFCINIHERIRTWYRDFFVIANKPTSVALTSYILWLITVEIK